MWGFSQKENKRLRGAFNDIEKGQKIKIQEYESSIAQYNQQIKGLEEEVETSKKDKMKLEEELKNKEADNLKTLNKSKKDFEN